MSSRSIALTALTTATLAFSTIGCRSNESTTTGTAPTAAPAATATSSAVAVTTPSRCAARGAKRFEPAFMGGASSAVSLVRTANTTFALVADHDERALHIVDTVAMRQVGVTPLDGRPGHVFALANGTVVVTLRDSGRVVVLEPSDDGFTKPFEQRCEQFVSAEPWALALEGQTLAVTSGFGAALTLLDVNSFEVKRVVQLPREPRAVLFAGAGQTAFVTHVVGGIVSAIDLKDPNSTVETISLVGGRRVNEKGEFDDKSTRLGSQGYALARVIGPRSDGTTDVLRIFAPHTSVDPGAPAMGPTITYGGSGQGPRTIAPIVSVVDPVAKRSITNHIAGVFNSIFAQDCLLPRSAVADERSLLVACMDIDAVIEMDPGVGDPSTVERRRINVPAGPSALSMSADGKQVFVWSELDRALTRIEREGFVQASVTLFRRAGETRDAKVERGRRLFHTTRDARIALGRGCASCHPDGRDDGLIWTSPDGLRQTPILAGRVNDTAPYGWSGEHRDVRHHLNSTLGRLGGTGLEKFAEDDLDALIAYVSSLPPLPKEKPKEPDLVERGKQVYDAYGCEGCHKGGGTDRKKHDVGSGKGRNSEFDTPSLVGIRGSAPYYHDGRYSTLDEMLSAKDQRMFPGTLAGADKKALIAYLETL